MIRQRPALLNVAVRGVCIGGVCGIEPAPPVPGLWALQRNGVVAFEDLLFDRPLQYVDALGGTVTTIHPDVLVPRSQPLINLLRRALEQIRPDLPAAPARNRMETALNDGGQQVIRRFLAGAPARLNPGGRVIIGYADHSGPKAIANLERFITEAGLAVCDRWSDRIKTHRNKKAWETVYAYHLRR